MFVLDLARSTKCALRVVINSEPYTYNLPKISRPRLIAGLVGLALAYAKASTSRAATATCVNEQLRQESDVNPVTGQPYSTELPDCRAYELVSSGNKNDSDAMLSPIISGEHSGLDNFGLVFEDGGRLLWEKSVEPYSGSNNGVGDVYEAARGAGGWSQTDALEPSGVGSSSRLFTIGAASSDSSTIVLETSPRHLAGQPQSGEDELIERSANGSYTPIVKSEAPSVELSADGSHVFFQTPTRLAGDTHSEGGQVYEWTSTADLHPVGVNDHGDPVSTCGATFAGMPSSAISYPSVSENGKRVFFASPDPEKKFGGGSSNACAQPSELYVRENGAATVEISKAPAGAAECEAGVTECEASFVGATPDGSRVFFVTSTQLTPDKQNSDPDLYEYDLETQALTRLSAGPVGYDDADVALPATTGTFLYENLQRSVIVSSDGSHVYFTGRGQLVPGAGATETTNEANDAVNLYMYASGAVSFIATIGPGTWDSDESAKPNAEAPLGIHVAEVTPDGSDLLFETDTRLTAYDSEGRGELYRYDAPTHTISCVSCNPSVTEPPKGFLDPNLHTNFWGLESGPVQQFGGLSNDGSTVFFAAAEQLLPAASNAGLETEGNPIFDIYEWHDGVLSLISSGTSPSSDFLLGASLSGSDVFFMSGSQLVPQDSENSAQIYDARTEGGFSAPATPAPCASAATCRSIVATPPTTIPPATVSVSASGNVTTVTGSEAPPSAKPKVESPNEKLTKALKACKRDKAKARRKSCEKSAHRRYASKPKPKAKK
jgi:hypothetical protein